MSYIKDNFAPISFDSQKMEIAGIACLRKIASLKISPKFEKFSYQRSILKVYIDREGYFIYVRSYNL